MNGQRDDTFIFRVIISIAQGYFHFFLLQSSRRKKESSLIQYEDDLALNTSSRLHCTYRHFVSLHG